MPKTTIKKIVNKDLLNNLKSLLDIGNASSNHLNIIYPKYLKLRECLVSFKKLLKMAGELSVVTPEQRQAIANLLADMRVPIWKIDNFNGEYTEEVVEANLDLCNDNLRILKESHAIEVVTKAYQSLLDHRKDMDAFLLRNIPFYLSNHLLDVDWSSVAQALEEPTVLTKIFQKMCDVGEDMYNTFFVPEMDLEVMETSIIAAIEEMQKHVPRCNMAFDLLLANAKVLRQNMPTYYKDYVLSSNSSSVLIESFIGDVSKSVAGKVHHEAELKRQFRCILIYMQKTIANSSSQNNNTSQTILNLLQQIS